jgi:hypothetical protein
MMASMMQDAAKGDGAASKWARRIVSRQHHREIHATSATTNATDLKASTQLVTKLKEKYPEVEFIWDKSEAKIHSMLLPDDMNEEKWVQLRLVGKRGETRLLGDQSHILRRVPRSFQVARIYADIDPSDDARRVELRDFAANEYAKLEGR